jgi:hypothetical protein
MTVQSIVTACSKHNNEVTGSIKGENLFQLSDCHTSKKMEFILYEA